MQFSTYKYLQYSCNFSLIIIATFHSWWLIHEICKEKFMCFTNAFQKFAHAHISELVKYKIL